jgi:radical SAM superfamily enzyme YgiQ (UPF0313 family)
MKIALINPGKFSTYQPPLSLAYIASYLDKYSDTKHSIKVIDENAGDIIEDEISKNEPDIVGITASTPQIADANRIASFMKENYPKVPIILGGVHISSIPEQTLREFKNFDIGVIGEGELTFLELINLFCKKEFTQEKLKNLNGIAFKDDDKIIITQPRSLIEDIDTIPFPARRLLKMKEYYLKPRSVVRGIIKRSTQIMSSRGCPYNCIFCASHIIHKNKFRAHSAQYIIKEIEHLIDMYKIQALYFQDDTFSINKKRVEDICRMIIERGINKKLIWSVQLRANLISNKDIELLKLMKKAGCIQTEFGFESGNDRMLSMLKKNSVTVEQNSNAIKLCKKVGFRVLGNFMIGAPTETIDEINDTKNFILKHKKMLDSVCVHLTTPYPGTELWEICKQKNLIKNLSWSDLWMGQVDKGAAVCSDVIKPQELLQIYNEIKLSTLLDTSKIMMLKKILKNPKKFIKWLVIFQPAFKNKLKKYLGIKRVSAIS